MNALDRKILETLGYKPFEDSLGFRFLCKGKHRLNVDAKQSFITTDMLVEAACKEWDWWYGGQRGDGVDGSRAYCRYNKRPIPAGIENKKTFTEALRAALAAHWGIEDA